MNLHRQSMWTRNPVFHAAALGLLIGCAIISTPAATTQQAAGFDPYDPAKGDFYASPGSIPLTQGKYPTSVSFLLWLKGCTPGQTSGPYTLSADSTYTITVAGPGLSTSSSTTVAGCKLMSTLNIDSSTASPGFYIVDVVATPKAVEGQPAGQPVDRGYAILSLLDATAAPIPANQQVDVIWGVLSKHLCADDFGKHLAKDVYCIEVKIGNNTGHSIQLAGVGFKPRSADSEDSLEASPNIAYQSVRAAAQQSQLFNSRSAFINGFEAVGILMGSVSPFFRTTLNVARWTTGIAIAGTGIPDAIEQIAPDMSTRELNNLDDQTFRDGMIIPNNTQIRTMVFVERKLLEGSGKSFYQNACDSLYLPDLAHPNQDEAITKNAPAKDTLNPTGDAQKPTQSTTGASSDAESSEKLKLSAVANCVKTKDDPMAVKWALGHLVIVGEEIDFIQRMVVDSNALTQASNANPVIAHAVATATAITFTFQGTAPANATATVQSASDVSFATAASMKQGTAPSPSELVFNLASGQFTDSVDYTVVLTAPGVAPITQIVQAPVNVNAAITPGTPATNGVAATAGTVTLKFTDKFPANVSAAIKSCTGTAAVSTGPLVGDPANKPGVSPLLFHLPAATLLTPGSTCQIQVTAGNADPIITPATVPKS